MARVTISQDAKRGFSSPPTLCRAITAMLDLVEATQKLLEDQGRDRKAKKKSWWRLGGDG